MGDDRTVSGIRLNDVGEHMEKQTRAKCESSYARDRSRSCSAPAVSDINSSTASSPITKLVVHESNTVGR